MALEAVALDQAPARVGVVRAVGCSGGRRSLGRRGDGAPGGTQQRRGGGQDDREVTPVLRTMLNAPLRSQ